MFKPPYRKVYRSLVRQYRGNFREVVFYISNSDTWGNKSKEEKALHRAYYKWYVPSCQKIGERPVAFMTYARIAQGTSLVAEINKFLDEGRTP